MPGPCLPAAWPNPFVPGSGLDGLCDIHALLVAQGVLERDDALAAVRQAAAFLHRDVEQIGSPLAGRLGIALDRHVWAWERARKDADTAIRKALAPLLARWAPPVTIMQAAHEMNEGFGFPDRHIGPLMAHEVRQIADEETAWWLRTYPSRNRRNAA